MRHIRNKLILPTKQTNYYTVIIACVYFFFNEYCHRLLTSSFACIAFALCTIALWMIYGVANRKIKFRLNFVWFCALAVMLISSEKAIEAGNYYWCTIFLVLTAEMMILSTGTRWIEDIARVIVLLGNIHIFSTIILWLFSPGLYNATLYHFWEGAPGGVSLNDAYKAGISPHYSSNGIYCAVMVLFYSSKIMAVENKRYNRRLVVLWMASILALLLTTKRAHLLFSILAIMGVYFFVGKGNKTTKTVKIIGACLAGAIMILCMVPVLPIVQGVIGRFTSDDISTGRFDFWRQAFAIFETNRMFGIGWGEYRFVNIYGTSVHNTYLQLLCETGIVGLTIFVIAMFTTVRNAIKDYRRMQHILTHKMKTMLMFSIAVQLFVLAYCMTGNCFYDITVIIYYLACSISIAFHSLQENKDIFATTKDLYE